MTTSTFISTIEADSSLKAEFRNRAAALHSECAETALAEMTSEVAEYAGDANIETTLVAAHFLRAARNARFAA